MDPKERKYEIVTARRFDLASDEWVREAKTINEADERDGTLQFIEALFDEAMSEEPDYKW